MATHDLAAALAAVLPAARRLRDEPLARHTTFRVGGPADWLVDVRTMAELRAVLDAVAAAGAPLTLLGGGSNVLVSDAGVRGVVLRLRLTSVSQPAPDVVRAEAGLTMNGLVRWTIGRGLAGLEAWAGTPGTVGGAIHGNAHWSGVDVGRLVRRVLLAGRDGALVEVAAADMAFAYDASRLQTSGELLVWADFEVDPGADPDALRAVARESLAYRKRTQPLALASAGCVFQNPVAGRDDLPSEVPASAGALIDLAGLKGHRVGGATISTVHGNFVTSDGSASASDVRAVIETARTAVREQFGVDLRDEVVYLGQF